MKFLATAVLLACVALLSQAAPNCHLSELTSCFQIYVDWLHSIPKRTIPETEAEVVVFCDAINKAVDCALGYRDNCTTPLQKELVGLSVEGALDLHKDFCTPGSETRTNYLAHSVCMNKISQMDEIKEQVEYIITLFEKSQSVPETQLLTYGCCGYIKVRNAYRKLGKDNCGQDTVDMAEGLIARAFGQLPEVICGSFEDTEDRCKEILPPDGSKPSDDVKKTALSKFIFDWLNGWLE